MINRIGAQASPQSQIKFKSQNTQPGQETGMPPVHKYVERYQIINLTGATVFGTVFGLLDAKTGLKNKINFKNNPENALTVAQKKVLESLPESATIKSLFKAEQLLETSKKVGGKILMAAGSMYVLDFMCQKIFKNNKEYEESYQDSLKK